MVTIHRIASLLFWVATALCVAALAVNAQENLVVNGGFESPTVGGAPAGWDPFWSRDSNAGSMDADLSIRHAGTRSLRISHKGERDWSVAQTRRVPVAAGEIYLLSGWTRGEQGEAQLGVVTRDAAGETLDWSYGSLSVGGAHDWHEYRRRLVIPKACASVQVRLIGNGAARLWLDDASLQRTGSVAALRAPTATGSLSIRSRFLDIKCSAETGALTVIDRRIGRSWHQQAMSNDLLVERAQVANAHTIRLGLLYLPSDLRLSATVETRTDGPEISVSLDGAGTFDGAIPYPHPFVCDPGSWIVLPMNEGILYPVDDMSVPATRLVAYGGHGICMPWYGATNEVGPDAARSPGVMTILNTPDDASIDVTRRGAKGLYVQPLWEPSRGALRYARKLTYVFTDRGGYVAQAKRYREYAKATGLFKTLAEKRAENPAVDLLVGAANVWNWDMDKLALCREFKAAGVDRLLWSSGGSPQEIRAINEMGYLTSRYDIYQDVWQPDAPQGLNREGWPADLVWLPDGSWMHGWAHIQHHTDGTQTVYQGGVISSPRGLERARIKIPEDLKSHPYRCRFIDTTTASPFREDYNPAHPLTRSDDRRYKMALLEFCSKDQHLVVGTETGIDPSVPFVHYYEGMMSLGPFRLPDAGYDMLGYRKPTPQFLKFMVGSTYRAPLWELVYHECVIAGWYWGDGSNKAPEVWDRRDLFNILYATPPLFIMNREMWAHQKDRFIASCRATLPVARRFGYDEMLSHRFVTPDHQVQATRWRSGKDLVVNFGDKPYRLPGGETIKPLGWTLRQASPQGRKAR